MDYLYEAKKILSGCLFLPVEKIPDNAALSDVATIDSVNFALIVSEVEGFIRCEVDPLALLELRTVQDLAKLLETYHASEVC